MKYFKQFGIIITISFVGELLHEVIPLPVPASIYGLVLMLAALISGFLRISQVKEAGKFLIEIMPLMFFPAAVGLLDSWGILQPILIPILIITVITTVLVMAVSGIVTQKVIQTEKRRKK